MLQNIPTHVIAGPLGAGKTSLIRHLLAQRPASERWAVLVNEFGQVGLDAALLACDDDGIAIGEVAGGCLCCVNGMPFQVGLGRLLRKARPNRVFIEPSGLGHPLQLLQQLGQSPWAGVLAVQPLLMVLDAQALARGERLAQAQQAALAMTALLVFNKSDSVDDAHRLLITKALPDIRAFWTTQGTLPLNLLPGFSTVGERTAALSRLPVDNSPIVPAALWTDPTQPICQAQAGEGGWSVGWRWHPTQRFDLAHLQRFLHHWAWQRAKGVIHSPGGWQSFNTLAGADVQWQPSEWRKDSRLELIFDAPQPLADLQAGLAACRLHS
ncbi:MULTISPECIES: CobW family GTP-binding protein [Pseudomonas]|uniref:Cobalamin biosynthesis protein CobW n=1 Tax=Pseudomonas mosselii TaxID=78327 RepID=A0A5R8YVA5_9PSED|nr:CobW family GTP-binding protein [Pseudomonas mosselii]TLP57410.1 cobalamin biosynthesis protein CobW [Pseudomonas mosselii]